MLCVGGAVWFGLTYTGFYLFDAITNVPYEALGPEITDDIKDRNRLFFVAKFLNLSGGVHKRTTSAILRTSVAVGMLLASAAPAFIIYLLRHPRQESMDCRSLFSVGNLPQSDGIIHPSPPFYLDGEFCRQSAFCPGSYEKVCFREDYNHSATVYLETNAALLEQCPQNASFYKSDILGCDKGSGGVSEATVEFRWMTLSYLDAQKSAFFYAALCFGLFYIAAMVHCVFALKERSKRRNPFQVPLLPSLYRSLQNRAFRPLLCAWAMDGLALSILTTLFPFFVRYVIISDGTVAQRSNQAMDPLVCVSACMVAFLLSAIASTLVWLRISQRVGKYRVWLGANLLSIITNLLFMTLQEGNTHLAIAVMFLNGLPIGAQFLTSSVLADVIDYDEFLNGTRSEGSFSVFATMIPKFMSIPGSAYPLALIYGLGFRPPIHGVSQSQPDFVRLCIQLMFVFIPILLAAAGFICKLFFPLKHEQILHQIQQGIAAHEEGEAARDPLTGNMVQLGTLSPEEYKIVRLFENFAVKRVQYMLKKQETGFVQLETWLYALVGFAASGCLCIVIFLSFPLVQDRQRSFIPVTSVLFFGVALFFSLLSLSKMVAAWKLQDFDFTTHKGLLSAYLRGRGGNFTDADAIKHASHFRL